MATSQQQADAEHEALMAAVRSSQALDEEEAAAALLAHAAVAAVDSDDHDTDDDDDRSPTVTPVSSASPIADSADDSQCVICFERTPNVTLDPCGHSNLCDVCVSRLVKRRCPTCRARARKVAIRGPDDKVITKAVREVIAERKEALSRVLEDTLQVVFLGPEKVGKKTLVRKLIAKFPKAENDSERMNGDVVPPEEVDVFSDGTDFSANARIGDSKVRLTVLRRTTLTSRRMVLDDVRVLKPDVLVLCCSAHVGNKTFDAILQWDKVLRNNFQKPRVWALLTLDDPGNSGVGSLETGHDVAGAINAIIPTDLRPKGHYLCSPGEQFSIGFRSLAKDIVSLGRLARDEELAAALAMQEARTMADQEAAGIMRDHAAANLVIANNGIGVPSSSNNNNNHSTRSGNSNSRGHGVGRSFSLRGFRERNSNGGQGVSFSSIVSWLSGSHES